VVAAAEEL
jgi:hypothetical protein